MEHCSANILNSVQLVTVTLCYNIVKKNRRNMLTLAAGKLWPVYLQNSLKFYSIPLVKALHTISLKNNSNNKFHVYKASEMKHICFMAWWQINAETDQCKKQHILMKQYIFALAGVGLDGPFQLHYSRILWFHTTRWKAWQQVTLITE